jgi:triosephosphate isomerase (TIM)
MRPLIGTSWKMNFTATQAGAYLAALRPMVADITDRDLFVLPAFPAIPTARDRLAGTNVAWGAQDVHPDDWGAHTGDVSAPMLADLGCRYVEVGHAERRRDHGETSQVVAAKVAAILRWEMSPIVCIGEVRRRGPEAALAEVLPDLEQCLAGVPPDALHRIVIAYEPVWAIGERATAAAPDEIRAVHVGIHAWLSGLATGGEAVRVIYGGSVDETIAPHVLGAAGVDGLFVGRRALDPASFAAIARTPVPPAAGTARNPAS